MNWFVNENIILNVQDNLLATFYAWIVVIFGVPYT